MSIQKPEALLQPDSQWFNPDTGRPSRDFYLYMLSLDRATRNLVDAANAAAVTLADHETRITALEP